MRALEGKDKGLFRDIIIEDEYDPLDLCKRHIKYDPKKRGKDPIKICLPEYHADEVRAETARKRPKSMCTASGRRRHGGRTRRLGPTLEAPTAAAPFRNDRYLP